MRDTSQKYATENRNYLLEMYVVTQTCMPEHVCFVINTSQIYGT
jgi:hypothetical protein